MGSLGELAEPDWILTWENKTWRLAPPRLGDWAQIEAAARAARPGWVDEVSRCLAGQPEEVQRRMLEAAYDARRRSAVVSGDELREWLRTAAGRLQLFWLMLRRHQPQLSWQQAAELAEALGRADWRQLAQACEADLELALGN